jgi:hypothetical protein
MLAGGASGHPPLASIRTRSGGLRNTPWHSQGMGEPPIDQRREPNDPHRSPPYGCTNLGECE